MGAQTLDGRTLSARIQQGLREEMAALQKKTGGVPAIVNLMIGDSDGSASYAGAQQRAARELGIHYELVRLPSTATHEDVLTNIRRLNADHRISGIMIHKPLPDTLHYQAVANSIDPCKDIEGIHVDNIGQLLLGEPRIVPCTAAAVMQHLKASGTDLYGREAVIVGASEIVGKPLSLLLLRELATVTVCHIATTEAGRLPDHVGRADILIVAVGKAGLVRGEWIKPGAVVIDVGISRVRGKLVGDVEFEAASQRAAFITPVPGGVGPVTVMMLMQNGIRAYALQKGLTSV